MKKELALFLLGFSIPFIIGAVITGSGGSPFGLSGGNLSFSRQENTNGVPLLEVENTGSGGSGISIKNSGGGVPVLHLFEGSNQRGNLHYNVANNYLGLQNVEYTGNNASIRINASGQMQFFDGADNDQSATILKDGGMQYYNFTSEPAAGEYSVVYATDVSGSSELFVKDEAGNITQLSAHGFTQYAPSKDDPLPIQKRYCNEFTGECVEIDLITLAKEVEVLSGKTIIHEYNYPTKEWDTHQENLRLQAEEEGKVYTKKAPPSWLQNRLVDQGRGSAITP